MFRNIEVQFEPIERWPGEPTSDRQKSLFKSGLDDSYRLLERELLHLGVESAVIQMDCDRSQIRRDGLLRADARSRPGVIISFESKNGPLSYPCDTFDHWCDNIRAIALALEALRKVDRYGVCGNGEQYRGWQALPSPNGDHWTTKEPALEFLRKIVPGTLASDGVEAALLAAERLTHPDRGGDADDFKKVQRARQLLTERNQA